jgi:hypothetical protein
MHNYAAATALAIALNITMLAPAVFGAVDACEPRGWVAASVAPFFLAHWHVTQSKSGRRNSERQVRIKQAGTVCDHRAGP